MVKKTFLKLKRFFNECKRVLRVTKKPDWEEFKMLVKVTGAGLLIIGAIGFLIFLIDKILTSMF